MTTVVRDHPEQHRYEIHVDDRLAGFSQYQIRDGRIAFTHTEVGEEFSGRGLARKLVADQLSDSRRRGLAVLPFCPYVRKVIADHPDRYLDLVPEAEREDFGLPADGSDVAPGRQGGER